jgi:hypothetical protein
MINNVAILMQTKVTRRQFLAASILSLSSIFGLRHIITLVLGERPSVAKKLGIASSVSTAYGHKK